MLYAAGGTFEIRHDSEGDSVILAGKFPYNAETELARGRFETFASRALRARPDAYLLAGHDFAKPLASLGAGSLTLRDADDALSFEARIAPDVASTSHGRDTLALVRAGLSVGLSPGFRVAADGEAVERRNDGLHRTVRQADLFELSIVTRPAYTTAQVEARSWNPHDRPLYIEQGFVNLPSFRWR